MANQEKRTTIGGQALIEGIMMQGPKGAAMSVRLPSGEIETEMLEVKKLKDKLKVLKDSDIIAYKSLLSQSELDKLDLEEQNKELHRQISKLKDIKLSSMEEKLNKTIELLTELTSSVVENRAVSYAVGDTICGAERFKSYVERAKEELKNE